MMEEAGYEVVADREVADIYIVNTCSVTNIADRKSRQMLHRFKSAHPEAVVVAAGCYAQAAGEELLQDEAVDIILGNDRKKDVVAVVEQYLQDRRSVACLEDLTGPRDYETLWLTEESTHTRAYIKIQDGCNQFCSYCIIPYTRGRIRSRAAADVVEEIRGLAAQGICEVVLTGIHVSSYGLDTAKASGDYGGQPFAANYLADLIEQVAAVPGIARIRLSSLEPRIITEDFVSRMAAIPSLCPHFHLSLQSGCDAVLQRMNRHYTTQQYADGLALLRRYFDDPALTTDVIVGFPGETEEEFAQTKDYLESIGLYQLHVFKYSRRRGTVADRMSGQLTDAVKSVRSDELLALTARQDADFRRRHVGRTAEVLWEEEKTMGGQRYMTGYTKEYIRVARRMAGDHAPVAGCVETICIGEELEGDIMEAGPIA